MRPANFLQRPLKSSYFPSNILSFLLLLNLCAKPMHEHLCSAQSRAFRAEICFFIVQIIYIPFIILKFVVAFQKMIFATPEPNQKSFFEMVLRKLLWITVFPKKLRQLCLIFVPARLSLINALFQKSSDLKIISYAPQSRRATYPRRLSFQKTHSVVSPKAPARHCSHSRTVFIKKFFISIIYPFQLSSLKGRFFWTFFEK